MRLTVNQAIINLQQYQKQKLKEKLRKAITKGLPHNNIYYYTHHYGNAIPMISFICKIDFIEEEEQFIDGLPYCKDESLQIVSRK